MLASLLSRTVRALPPPRQARRSSSMPRRTQSTLCGPFISSSFSIEKRSMIFRPTVEPPSTGFSRRRRVLYWTQVATARLVPLGELPPPKMQPLRNDRSSKSSSSSSSSTVIDYTRLSAKAYSVMRVNTLAPEVITLQLGHRLFLHLLSSGADSDTKLTRRDCLRALNRARVRRTGARRIRSLTRRCGYGTAATTRSVLETSFGCHFREIKNDLLPRQALDTHFKNIRKAEKGGRFRRSSGNAPRARVGVSARDACQRWP